MRLGLGLALTLCAGCGRVSFEYASDGRQSADADRDTSLVGSWSFDEGTGASAADASGHGNTGQLLNGSFWTSGAVGPSAVAFDGITAYVDAGNAASLNNIPVKTVSAWIKPAATSSNQQVFVGKDASALCGWELSVGPTNEIRFRQCFNPSDGVWSSAANLAPVGEWHHVALVYDRTSVANQPAFYVDGTAQALAMIQAGVGSEADESARHLGIGANAVDNTENFNGAVDEVRIYSRALSATEIQQLP